MGYERGDREDSERKGTDKGGENPSSYNQCLYSTETSESQRHKRVGNLSAKCVKPKILLRNFKSQTSFKLVGTKEPVG